MRRLVPAFAKGLLAGTVVALVAYNAGTIPAASAKLNVIQGGIPVQSNMCGATNECILDHGCIVAQGSYITCSSIANPDANCGAAPPNCGDDDDDCPNTPTVGGYNTACS
jgi:hypothetical protein